MPTIPYPRPSTSPAVWRRRLAGLALSGVLALGAASCTRTEEPPAGPQVPVHRLADEVATAAGEPEAASGTIGDVTRYVLRPVPKAQLFPPAGPETVHADAAGRVEVSLTCPPSLAGQTLVLKAITPEKSWIADGTITCPADGDQPVLHRLDGFAPGTETMPFVVGYGAMPERISSGWLTLDPRASLRVALGIATALHGQVPAPVRFTVRLEGRRGSETTVLTQTLDPATRPTDGGWTETRVELSAALQSVGPEVRLHFDTVALGPGPRGFPLWGSPAVMAPGTPAPADGSAPPRNIVLVSIDTLRADHLGTYGYPRPTSPNLDRLASEGVLFETAVAQANWTLPSHATMLTGAYVCAFDMAPTHGFRPMPPGITPLAEILRRRGYATAAFTEDAYVSPEFFQRGFGMFRADSATVVDSLGETIQHTVGGARRWLEEHADEPFFLFVHTYQVHGPYLAPAGYRELIGLPSTAPSPMPDDAGNYAAAIRYADDVLGSLIALLHTPRFSGRTILIVTSDHGEAFGEHGRTGHGWTLYDEELRVPLIWWGPGLIPRGRRVQALVGLVDLVPTVLDLLGIRAWSPAVMGNSLKPLLMHDEGLMPGVRDRVLFSENPTLGQVAVRGQAWKGIDAAPEPWMYDLIPDPGEMYPRHDPGLVALARHWLTDYRAMCDRARFVGNVARVPQALPTPDEPHREKLRALGYVQ